HVFDDISHLAELISNRVDNRNVLFKVSKKEEDQIDFAAIFNGKLCLLKSAMGVNYSSAPSYIEEIKKVISQSNKDLAENAIFAYIVPEYDIKWSESYLGYLLTVRLDEETIHNPIYPDY
ncbi:hypothetical protein ROZALSC1DRAFT_30466, partial [Rozella allomycis CSF55]